MNLSFAGCGFLGIYHVGVACCFKKYAPHMLLNKISGASAGAIAACCLICDMPLGEMTSDVLRVVQTARSFSFGPLSPKFNITQLLYEGLDKFLPEDVHKRVNGRLHVSLTRVHDGKNVMVSEFDTREEVIQVLLASAFIPIFSGVIPPKYKGIRYMDGGYSDNLPTLDENTITVSPFCGESDICPRDDSSQLFHINVANTSIELSKHNMYRIMRIIFPPPPEVLSNMCKQGFDDALRFLHRNNLLNCTRCIAVQSTFIVSDLRLEENLEYDPQCKECVQHRQDALESGIPDTVLELFQEAMDSSKLSLTSWIFKRTGFKLLSVLTLPYTIPADIMLATLSKLLITAPKIGNTVWDLSKYFMDQVKFIMNKVNMKGPQHSAKVTCRVAMTEYDRKKDVEACHDQLSTKNKMNLNFTLNIDSDIPGDESPDLKAHSKVGLQRQPSFTVSGDNDTFEHILKITSHHESIMTYYYLDENNKVKVTEILDVTDSDSPVVQTNHEREVNQNLTFDDDWESSTWDNAHNPVDYLYLDEPQNSPTEITAYSLEDILDKDSSNLFSDPECEWNETYKVEEPEDEYLASDLRPECEQPQQLTSVKIHALSPITCEDDF